MLGMRYAFIRFKTNNKIIVNRFSWTFRQKKPRSNQMRKKQKRMCCTCR